MSDCSCGARGIDLDGHECVAWLRLELIKRDEQIQALRTENWMGVKSYNDMSFQLKEAEQRTAEQLAALGPWTVQTLRQYVADTSDGFECLPGCDSFGHEELCPVTNTVQAFRLLRERLAELEQANKEGWETATQENDVAFQAVQKLKAAQERLAEAERLFASTLSCFKDTLSELRHSPEPCHPACRMCTRWMPDYDKAAQAAEEYFAKHEPEDLP